MSGWHLETGADSHLFDGRVVDQDGKCVAFVDLEDWSATFIALAPKISAERDHFEALAEELLAALQAAVECGLIPTSSASDGGSSKYVHQIRVADQIRAAIAKATGEDAR